MKTIVPLALTIGITVYLIVGTPTAPLECLLIFVGMLAGLTALSFFLTPMHLHMQPSQKTLTTVRPQLQTTRHSSTLPPIPHTVQGILSTMNDRQFEYFCAAIVIGLREGYTFVMRCGGTGDQGADIIMRNAYGLRIIIQAKQWTDNTIGSKEIREFSGTLIHYEAIAGFFITTSTFSRDARAVIDKNPVRIKAIDKTKLEYYLQTRSHEIALAWKEIIEQTGLAE